MTRSIEQWFEEYSESHRHPANQLIHWFAVPGIFATVVGLLWSIPVPPLPGSLSFVNWATLTLLLVVLFYLRLSRSLALGMLVFSTLVILGVNWIDVRDGPALWKICLVAFAGLWLLQFVGHAIEGKRPSFLADVQFLLIGPAWLLGKLYRRFGIPF